MQTSLTYTDGEDWEIEKRQTIRVNWGDWENGKRVREEVQITKHKNQRREEQWGCQPEGSCNGVLSLFCVEAVIMACWLWLSPSPLPLLCPPQEGLNVLSQPLPRLSEPRHARCPSEEVISNLDELLVWPRHAIIYVMALVSPNKQAPTSV